MQLGYDAITDPGARPVNEDSYQISNYNGARLFTVADGLGGLPGGEWASHYFCLALEHHCPSYMQSFTTEPQTPCKQLFQQAAREMIAKLQTIGQPMGRTTAAAVWLTDSVTLAAHVGDSRIYYFGSDYIWRSHDHSYAQLLVDKGQITEDEMAHHPSQTQLLRSIGADEDPSPEIKELPPLKPDDRLVLCTDGFWEYTGTETMDALSRKENFRQALEKHTAVIKDRAGPVCDNITAIIIRR